MYVRFKRSNGDEVWVNSHRVLAVQGYGSNSSLHMNDNTFMVVKGPAKVVAQKLNRAEED